MPGPEMSQMTAFAILVLATVVTGVFFWYMGRRHKDDSSK